MKCKSFATATFYLWDDTMGTYTQYHADNYEVGSLVTFPRVPDKTGYTFSGWYLDEDLTGSALDKHTIENNVTFYAKYTPKTYTVTWKDWNGTELKKVDEVAYGTTASDVAEKAPADPIRTSSAQYDYTFTGWDKEYADVTVIRFTLLSTEKPRRKLPLNL